MSYYKPARSLYSLHIRLKTKHCSSIFLNTGFFFNILNIVRITTERYDISVEPFRYIICGTKKQKTGKQKINHCRRQVHPYFQRSKQKYKKISWSKNNQSRGNIGRSKINPGNNRLLPPPPPPPPPPKKKNCFE